MSRIDDLIQQHCPHGVEYRRLGEVARIKNGRDYRQFDTGTIPVYGSGGIMARIDTAAHPGPSVLIPRKGSLSNIYYLDEPFWTGDTIFYTEIDETAVLPKFLYHVLVMMRLETLNQAGGVPSMTQTVLKRLQIPVPPLEIQEEVVRTLDFFESLGAELEAELEARHRQYEHYRHSILSFDAEHTTWSALGDLAIIGTGSRNTNEAQDDGQYPFFVRSQTPLAIDDYEFNETAIITAGDGVGVGKVFHFVNGPYALHQRAYRICPVAPAVKPRFFFHFIRHDFERYLAAISVHSSVRSLRRPMFERYPIPVPPLAEQERIIKILDAFDGLVNDLSIGLPAELAARRKQYEYYRDKLLTFEEAA